MSNVLALAMKVTADASQLSQSLTPVERALKKLGDEATKSASLFDQFAASSSAAAQAQTSVQQQFAALDKALQDGTINAKEYSEQFKAIQDGAKALASSFAEGQRVTEKFASDQERAAAETKRLDDLLKKGAISQATYNRAIQSLGEEAQKTDPALQQLAASVQAISAIQIGRAIIDVFQGIAGVVSGAVRSIAQWTSRITASVDATDKLAKRTGVAVEQLQALSVAAGLAGVDSQTLGTSIERLNASIGKAEAGGGLDRTFKRLGTSLQDLRRLAPEDQFKAIADAIGRIPNPSERAAAAVQVFGRSGQQLLPLFRDGAKSIDEIAKRAERLGIVLGADQVSNITNLNDSFSLVRQTIDGIIGQVIGDLAPAVTSVAEEFLKFVEEFNEGGQVEGGRAIAQAITDGIIVGVRAFLEAIRSFDGITSRLLASLSQIPGLDIRTDQQRKVDELELAIKANINSRDPITRLVFGIDKASLDLDLADLQRALAIAKSQSGQGGLAAAEDFVNQFEQKLAQTRSPQFKIETNIQRTRQEFADFVGAATQSVDVTANLSLSGAEEIDAARAALDSLQEERQASATLEFFGTGSIAEARQQLADLDGTTAEAFLVASGFDSIDQAKDKLAELSDVDVTATLQLLGTVSIDEARDRLNALSALQIEPRLQAVGFESIDDARAAIESLQDRSVTATLEFFGAESIEDARERLATLNDTTVQAEAFLQASGFESIEQAQAQLAQLRDVDVTATLELLGAESIDDARTRLEKLSLVDLSTVAKQLADVQNTSVSAFLKDAVDVSEDLANAIKEFEAAISAAQDPAQFTAEEIQRIKTAQEKVNNLLRSSNADRAEALELAEKQAAADAKLVDFFAKQQFGDPSADERVKAAETLAAVTRQIEAVEAEIAQARAGNDKLAEESATRRLAILDQAKTAAQEAVDFGFTTQDAQRTIEDFRGKLDEVFTFDNFTIAPDAFKEFQAGIDELDQQLRDKVIDPETYREAAGLLLQGFQDSVKEAEKLQDLQLSYAERVAQIDAERLEALSRASQEPLKVEDIRTSGGIAEFLRLATGREDPAIDEARKQTRELERLRAEIVRLGGQVEIIGAG